MTDYQSQQNALSRLFFARVLDGVKSLDVRQMVVVAFFKKWHSLYSKHAEFLSQGHCVHYRSPVDGDKQGIIYKYVEIKRDSLMRRDSLSQYNTPYQTPTTDSETTQNRIRAGELIEAVIDERMEPRVALNHWPDVYTGQDKVLDIAYQSLWHFEADEDRQKTEMFYMDAQLELLKQISNRLKKGEELPQYFDNQYDPAMLADFYRPKTPVTDVKLLAKDLGKYYLNALIQSWRLGLKALKMNRHH